jgi:hypothetical protein
MSYDESRRPKREGIYVCVCLKPQPIDVKLFGCMMPGYKECRLCLRPIKRNDGIAATPSINGGAVVLRSVSRSRRSVR